MSRCRSEPRLTEKHSGPFSHLLIGSPFGRLWDWLWFVSQSASKTEKAGSFDSLSDAIDASKPLKSMIEVKQLGKNFMKSNWKKYWAVLQNNSLYIYYDKTETAMVQVRFSLRAPRTDWLYQGSPHQSGRWVRMVPCSSESFVIQRLRRTRTKRCVDPCMVWSMNNR